MSAEGARPQANPRRSPGVNGIDSAPSALEIVNGCKVPGAVPQAVISRTFGALMRFVELSCCMTNSKSSRLTKPRLSTFARNLLEEWRRLELACGGGCRRGRSVRRRDSLRFLLALDELIKMEKLRPRTDRCPPRSPTAEREPERRGMGRQLAEDLGYKIVVGSANLKRGAVSQPKTLGRAGARTKTKAKTSGEFGTGCTEGALHVFAADGREAAFEFGPNRAHARRSGGNNSDAPAAGQRG